MAEIHIILKDAPEGQVDIRFKFDPPIEDLEDNDDCTAAQNVAAEIITFIHAIGETV